MNATIQSFPEQQQQQPAALRRAPKSRRRRTARLHRASWARLSLAISNFPAWERLLDAMAES